MTAKLFADVTDRASHHRRGRRIGGPEICTLKVAIGSSITGKAPVLHVSCPKSVVGSRPISSEEKCLVRRTLEAQDNFISCVNSCPSCRGLKALLADI
ncbi:hypothetical protein AcV7_002707 [Taiwanofungus camphoratus]|nr:hypothetical protein AcV7_002707 [Antrodia cinnamomea]